MLFGSKAELAIIIIIFVIITVIQWMKQKDLINSVFTCHEVRGQNGQKPYLKIPATNIQVFLSVNTLILMALYNQIICNFSFVLLCLSLEFVIDIILPAAVWLWGSLSL
jgi:hypothetical protein